MDSFFTPLQKRIITFALTALAAAAIAIVLYLTFMLMRDFLINFQGVLLPLVIAAIIANLLRPLIRLIDDKTRLNQQQSIIVFYSLVLLCLTTLGFLIIPLFIREIGQLLRESPEIFGNFLAFIQERFPDLWSWLNEKIQSNGGSKDLISEAISKNSEAIREYVLQAGNILGGVGSSFGSMLGSLAAYSVIPIYLFFILDSRRDVWGDVDSQITFLPKERREDVVFLVKQFSEILVAFFRGQIVIGLILGVILAIGLSLIGLKFGFVIGLAVGLMNIVPYLGMVIGLGTMLPLAYFQDGGGMALLGMAAGVFILGQIITDYVLTPRIMGNQTGMSSMLIVFSVFFWGTALQGIMGMVLAIPLTAFFLVFWRLARAKYIPEFFDSHGARETPPNSAAE
ncbi:MAG: AI-2E family transporter [Opitutales bacterium]|nr:AI-2E family transporter [Opitutales bacterium]